jgi:hypothetical protein
MDDLGDWCFLIDAVIAKLWVFSEASETIMGSVSYQKHTNEEKIKSHSIQIKKRRKTKFVNDKD